MEHHQSLPYFQGNHICLKKYGKYAQYGEEEDERTN